MASRRHTYGPTVANGFKAVNIYIYICIFTNNRSWWYRIFKFHIDKCSGPKLYGMYRKRCLGNKNAAKPVGLESSTCLKESKLQLLVAFIAHITMFDVDNDWPNFHTFSHWISLPWSSRGILDMAYWRGHRRSLDGRILTIADMRHHATDTRCLDVYLAVVISQALANFKAMSKDLDKFHHDLTVLPSTGKTGFL